MPKTDKPLEQELRAAGAAPKESKELAKLAISLSRLKGTEPRLVVASRKVRPLWRRLWLPAGLVASGLAVGMALVAVAQTSYPGQFLYPLKHASEAAAISVHPDYRGIVMMQRAQEVKQLVSTDGSPALVEATLNDYTNEATKYESLRHDNYAAFEYCRNNLAQAEALATGPERQEIANAVSQFNDTE